jgi:hypothetical protein
MKTKKPPVKKLIVVKGKGTPKEERIETNVNLYWSETLKRYVSIPQD